MNEYITANFNKMNKILISLLIFAFFSCKSPRKETIVNEAFQWEISLPINFNKIEPERWEKLKESGEKLIVNNTDSEIFNVSIPIFIIENGEFNRFDANYMTKLNFIEPNTTFLESFNKINTIGYDSFRKVAPDAEIDTVTTTENIGGLEFHKFEMITKFDENFIINSINYKRLFVDKVLSININFIDNEKGREIMKSLMGSKFK